MTISNNDRELEQRLFDKTRQMYINAHGHEPSEQELITFIRETLTPLVAKVEEIKKTG